MTEEDRRLRVYRKATITSIRDTQTQRNNSCDRHVVVKPIKLPSKTASESRVDEEKRERGTAVYSSITLVKKQLDHVTDTHTHTPTTEPIMVALWGHRIIAIPGGSNSTLRGIEILGRGGGTASNTTPSDYVKPFTVTFFSLALKLTTVRRVTNPPRGGSYCSITRSTGAQNYRLACIFMRIHIHTIFSIYIGQGTFTTSQPRRRANCIGQEQTSNE